MQGKTDDFTREDLLAVAQRVGIRGAGHIIDEILSSVAPGRGTFIFLKFPVLLDSIADAL